MKSWVLEKTLKTTAFAGHHLSFTCSLYLLCLLSFKHWSGIRLAICPFSWGKKSDPRISDASAFLSPLVFFFSLFLLENCSSSVHLSPISLPAHYPFLSLHFSVQAYLYHLKCLDSRYVRYICNVDD